MDPLDNLFQQNHAWARQMTSHDPEYFERHTRGQQPPYLWIGCSDSRVVPNDIVDLGPGELFVHRNVGNLVVKDDENMMAVLDFSVEALQVRHIIVCGHRRCKGVLTAMQPSGIQTVDRWVGPIREIYERHQEELDAMGEMERWEYLAELNAIEQIRSIATLPVVKRAWARGQDLSLHALKYNLYTGDLRRVHDPITSLDSVST